MSKLFAHFVKDESGATAIEYGLIAALIALAIVVGAGALGNALNAQFEAVADQLNAATPRNLMQLRLSQEGRMTSGLPALADAQNISRRSSGMSSLVATFFKDESGATAIEYGLIVALIALTMIVGAGLLGNAINAEFTGIAGVMNNSVNVDARCCRRPPKGRPCCSAGYLHACLIAAPLPAAIELLR